MNDNSFRSQVYNRNSNIDLGNMSKRNITLFAIVLFVIVYALLGITRTAPNEHIIIKNWNGNVRVDKDAGLGWYEPITNTVNHVPVAQINSKTKQDGTTADQVQTGFDLKITWRITNALAVFKQINTTDTDAVYDRILNPVSKAADVVANKSTFVDMKANTSKLNGDLLTAARERLSESFKGVEITDITVNNLTAPDSVQDAIAKKIARKQEADASAYDKEKAQNEADAQNIKKKVGEGQQRLEICKAHPESYACLPSGVKTVGGGIVSQATK